MAENAPMDLVKVSRVYSQGPKDGQMAPMVSMLAAYVILKLRKKLPEVGREVEAKYAIFFLEVGSKVC
jgi:hypothetical protein